ncbi:hypothetical protein BGX24_004449 [Mortierella sp. AD032]|nr:hypothetical protein BGX24_004449 [Mortierella sp. AD032]
MSYYQCAVCKRVLLRKMLHRRRNGILLPVLSEHEPTLLYHHAFIQLVFMDLLIIIVVSSLRVGNIPYNAFNRPKEQDPPATYTVAHLDAHPSHIFPAYKTHSNIINSNNKISKLVPGLGKFLALW